MDQSLTESDITMSPGGIIHKILERIQGGSISETPSSFGDVHKILDLLSSNSTAYTTFQRLLLDEGNLDNMSFQNQNSSPKNTSLKVNKQDLIEGISVMNISRESECLTHSPMSRMSVEYDAERPIRKAKIELDEMPIIHSKSDSQFSYNSISDNYQTDVFEPKSKLVNKKPFLRRGEGTSRFGISKKDLVIQPTNALPWKAKTKTRKSLPDKLRDNSSTNKNLPKKLQRKSLSDLEKSNKNVIHKPLKTDKERVCPKVSLKKDSEKTQSSPNEKINVSSSTSDKIVQYKPQPKQKTPQKTWANLLTTDQEQFLRQIKQESFYKNFNSPAKSTTSDINESLIRLSAQREQAEQNMFNLLEDRFRNESFNDDASFYKKLFKKTGEKSGLSTPIVTQKYLEENPDVFFLHPQPKLPNQSEAGDESQWEDCDQDDATNCTCNKTDFEASTPQIASKQTERHNKNGRNNELAVIDDSDELKRNMAEMNAKLIETGDLLKKRLHDLEDEIDAFRKENSNLGRMREDLEAERVKFYEERAEFEKKFNEEKILSEYYLAEEKEKLAQKKLHYDKCVREMRGRLTKKDNEEVIKLKHELEELKDQMRLKDAKSTTCVARLRNQIKILEKDNEELKQEIERIQKENRRMQQINTTTRRLSNIKYLSEINKKLSDIGNKITDSEYGSGDIKYRSMAIAERSRSRKKEQPKKIRAKSVPNLAVTSHYAQYFSQRNPNSTRVSDEVCSVLSEDEDIPPKVDIERLVDKITSNDSNSKIYDIEEIYHETFKSNPHSPTRSHEMLEPKRPEQLITQPKMSSTLDLTESTTSLRQNKSLGNVDNDLPYYDKALYKSQTNLSPREIDNPDGSKELRYPNGNVKQISADRKYTKFIYYNGDIQETFVNDGIIKYYYADNKTYQTTHKDGTEILQFPDGQIEKKYRDGSHEVHFPNGSIKYVDPKNKLINEEWRFPDGTVMTMSKDGEKVVHFKNGQVEVHNKDHKRREYPDGTVKYLYADGTTETRFSTGRVRIKDKNGKIVMDTSNR